MTKKNEPIRTYSMSDSEMLEESKIKQGHFIEDKAEFEAFDQDFRDPFVQNWQSQIASTELESSDSEIKGVQVQLTKKVQNIMKQCTSSFQDMKYFVEKAFPGDKAVLNEFGYNNYHADSKTQAKLILLMQQAYGVASKYKEQLGAAGFSSTKIDELLSLKDQLNEANQEQELYKSNRPVLTQDRIDKLNKTWEFAQKTAKAAKQIFKNNPAKLKQYS